MTAVRSKASGHYIRKRLRSAGLARRVAVFSALFLLTGILVYRLGGVDFEAMKAILASTLVLAVLALLLAGSALVRVWRKGHEGGGRAIGATAVAIVVLAPFAVLGILGLENPPGRVAATDGMLAADAVGEDADGAIPARSPGDELGAVINGRRFQATAAQVYAVTRLVLADIEWEVSGVEAGAAAVEDEGEDADLGVSGTVLAPVPTPRSDIDLAASNDPLNQPESDEYAVRAVAYGPIFALPSDVTIRIVEDGEESFVDMRSLSRTPDPDLGQNRRFIEDFLTRLDAAMAAVQSVVPEGQS